MHWGEFHSRFQIRSIGHLGEAGERLSSQEKEVFFSPKRRRNQLHEEYIKAYKAEENKRRF